MAKKWNVVASSVRGISHDKTGLPCQDAHGFAIVGECLIGVVADGAGSASHAELASRIAVATSIDYLTNVSVLIDCDVESLRVTVGEAINSARRSLEAEASAQSVSLREFATTVIVFLASANWIVAAQVGDGALVALCDNDELMAVTRPPVSEYLNEATFLTSDNYEIAQQTVALQAPIKRIAAFSDGLQMLALKYPEGDPFKPFFQPLFSLVEDGNEKGVASQQLEEFLGSPRINERTDDDKTLLIAGLV